MITLSTPAPAPAAGARRWWPPWITLREVFLGQVRTSSRARIVFSCLSSAAFLALTLTNVPVSGWNTLNVVLISLVHLCAMVEIGFRCCEAS